MAKMTNARVVSQADGALRVHVAPEVTFSFERSTAVLNSVLGRCGCSTCTSGLPIAFITEEGESAT
jgi:hypothetical protein